MSNRYSDLHIWLGYYFGTGEIIHRMRGMRLKAHAGCSPMPLCSNPVERVSLSLCNTTDLCPLRSRLPLLCMFAPN